jgi:tetratricopeptide (TPR) repeat protein
VKQLLKGLTQGGGALATMTGNPVVGGALAAASKGTDAVIDGASLALSEKDRVQSLVQSHKATRDKRDLQELLLDPLPHLTQAFVKSLAQWSAQKPIVLMLDTYEKADLATIDLWLWRSLLSNTDLRRYPIRLVVAGRYNLLNRQEWQTVQQTSELVKPYGPEEFTPAQTQEYLAEIGITDPATVERIYQTTKGWPYYLNKIRENQPTLDLNSLTQNLATFLINHLPASEQAVGGQLAQLAACCRWFDGQMIELLAQQFQMVPPLPHGGVAQPHGGCLAWLKEQTFVEPLAGGRWRLDDVARDVFRMALWQADPSKFQRTHDLLARYFKAKSSQAVAAQTPTSEKYENPDWLEPRAEYLYHLAFTPSATLQTTWLSHVLEATYLSQPDLVRAPLQGITEDYALAERPYLTFTTRGFLQQLRPAVEYGWAMLEEDPIDYPYNEANLGLSKLEIDQAIATCLQNSDQFEGLAKFAALLYKAKRCAEEQKLTWLQQAQAQAEQLLTVEPPDFLADLFLYKLGNTFYKASLFTEALTCCDKALALKPDKHEALWGKGVALSALGDKVGAIICYDLALAIKPDDHQALNNKGTALSSLGDKAGAIACYNAAIEIKPDYLNALYNKGNALSVLGQKEAAIACYDAALALKPDDHEALINKGTALSDLGQKEAAIACYDAALALKPDDHEALYNKGLAMAILGRYEEEVVCYDQALVVKPGDCRILNNKGVALHKQHKYEAAIDCYNQALNLEPNSFHILHNKGISLSALGRKDEAINCYDQAIKLNPSLSDALCDRGNALFALGRYDAAIASYRQVLCINPNDYEAHFRQGTSLSALGDFEAAIACYDDALEIKPDLYEALQSRGAFYFADGQLEKALSDFDRALEIQPQNQPLIAQRALVLMQMGDSSQLAIAQQALAATMTDPKLFEQIQQNIKQALAVGLSDIQQQTMQQIMASLNPEGAPLDVEALQVEIQGYQDLVEEHQELIQKSPEAWSYFMGAATAIMSGDVENTITQLQAAVGLVPEYKQVLQDDPESWPDDLRTDERFQALVAGGNE